MPAALRREARWAGARELASGARHRVLRLIYRQPEHFSHFKSHQFGGAAIREHTQIGLADVRWMLAQPRWRQLPEGDEGLVVGEG